MPDRQRTVTGITRQDRANARFVRPTPDPARPACAASVPGGDTRCISPPVVRPFRGPDSAQGSGCVAESADEVLVETEVFRGGFHGEPAVELFADAEVELA